MLFGHFARYSVLKRASYACIKVEEYGSFMLF